MKKRFRVGQRVQVACDPSQTFTIRKSRVPERIYFGANHWWMKNELQPLGAAENPGTSRRLNGITEHARTSAQCAQGHPREPESTPSPAKRSCLACNTIFEPVKPWQRFDSEECRRSYWKAHRPKVQATTSEAKAPEALATAVIQ